MSELTQTKPLRGKGLDLLVAFLCGGFVALMVGVSYAAVPLYSWFCRTTGFGGTTQVAHSLPKQQSARTITVRFDSNVAAGLPWRFEPEKNTVDVRLGQVVTVYYKVINETNRVTVGQAGYNVSPPTVGIFFEKINCFCFTPQTMQPGEMRDMAVVFYVDPKLAKDYELDGVSTITLSYTFYPLREPEQPVTQSAAQEKSGRI
ncbi:MAG TPA: cytochrome c oxidase assembly protein [Xanthobacteraceae bacterium]|nr:cytochrome c oxidase assembly protein [Xanthobacteraceae bacterium]